MGARTGVEVAALRALMGLPEPVQRVLAGPRLERDGQVLAADLQLMLRIQRLVREPAIETLEVELGRQAAVRQTGLTGGRQPIGSVREVNVAGLLGRLYTPSAAGAPVATPGPLLLFFHGGGFFFGDLETHDATCRFLAERAGVRVLAVDYRLSPEHPFPAAHDDALAAYHWVLEHAGSLGADPSRIAVGGDSAGGNLSATVAIDAARAGLPLAWQLLVYPATDVAGETESKRMFGSGLFLTQEFMDLAVASYTPDAATRTDPRVAPLRAELPAGLAPAYVVTAGFDPLRDEGEAYAAKLADAGVEVELRRFPDQIHGFLNIVGAGRTSRAACAEIADKLRAVMNPTG
ncbi:alpha/beta hydrolase [Nocardioides sp. Arc9.136]|uniref:alpha/beta hydrolase n=1 Tax=Nocardioides sp. Arc9.136 TaxID=2996826 RepID=UPI002665BB78|nr:alpha/beta hydrolase [Nocardioides sp. Arc9.136]WKN48079.1 alpha/beta hydrolase [Nocardioides sp. Arc9.136]